MILVDEVEEPVEEMLALILGHTVDVLDMATNREDALPTGDRVGADNGVDSLELAADVFGGTAGLIVQLEARRLGNFLEVRLLKGDRQALEELLIRLANTVVDLVAGGPEGICDMTVSFGLDRVLGTKRTTYPLRWSGGRRGVAS